MRKEVRRKKILDHIRQKLPKGEFEAKEDQLDVDCESMSSHSSEDNSLHSGESFRQLLGKIEIASFMQCLSVFEKGLLRMNTLNTLNTPDWSILLQHIPNKFFLFPTKKVNFTQSFPPDIFYEVFEKISTEFFSYFNSNLTSGQKFCESKLFIVLQNSCGDSNHHYSVFYTIAQSYNRTTQSQNRTSGL